MSEIEKEISIKNEPGGCCCKKEECQCNSSNVSNNIGKEFTNIVVKKDFLPIIYEIAERKVKVFKE